MTLEQAERVLQRMEGKPAAIANPFAAFPNRSLWLHRMMTEARLRR